MINILKILFVIFIMLAMCEKIHSQACCTAGTSSLGGVFRSIVPVNNLSIIAGYENNYLGASFDGRKKIYDPLKRSATVSYLTLQVEYGISEKVSVLAITSYTYRERNTTVTSPSDNSLQDVKFSGQGFGDIILLGKYEIVTPDFFSPFVFAVGGGAKLPVGDFRKEDNGSRLPIDLQPGTGAPDLLLWSYLSNSFTSLSLSIYGNLLYRYAGTNLQGYKIGDELLVALGANYNFTEYLTFSLQLRSRFANADYARRTLPSTGGTSSDLFIYLNYIEGKYLLGVYTMVPLYRNTRGIQLTNSQVLGVQLQYLVDLNN
ncbi:MAG: hypothetical protein KJ666_09490 [Bacteroidetes bacterium]|nr:hypothetical protein [Bacteroidota bacterium]MBU2584260.1 hypothetical protein [Bacteroidota bacterium]